MNPSSGPRPDPMKMANQPALQTSHGTVWVVMGGLFAIASLVPLGSLAFAENGRSKTVALIAALLVIALYLLLLIFRFALPHGPKRLRALAACMLTMAGVALIGVLLCALLENAPR